MPDVSLIKTMLKLNNIFCVSPCHYGTALPRVADGRDGLQILKVATNILKKLSRAAEKERSSRFGVWRETKNSST
jgi:hypothetical protein